MVTSSKSFANIRVLVADDNREMRNAIVGLIQNDYDVVGAVGDGRALVEAAMDLHPEIGIVDISMPIMNGIEAVADILARGSAMKAVFLTVNEDADFVRAAFEAGGVGYVVKRQMATDLPAAIAAALTGNKFVSPDCGLSLDY